MSGQVVQCVISCKHTVVKHRSDSNQGTDYIANHPFFLNFRFSVASIKNLKHTVGKEIVLLMKP